MSLLKRAEDITIPSFPLLFTTTGYHHQAAAYPGDDNLWRLRAYSDDYFIEHLAADIVLLLPVVGQSRHLANRDVIVPGRVECQCVQAHR